jgi:WhiB family redox-sensing transcriptional regulator
MDPELFFDTQGSQGYDEARVVCAGCRVQFECLEFALASDPPEKFGIWGGLSEMQRRKVRRARRRATL